MTIPKCPKCQRNLNESGHLERSTLLYCSNSKCDYARKEKLECAKCGAPMGCSLGVWFCPNCISPADVAKSNAEDDKLVAFEEKLDRMIGQGATADEIIHWIEEDERLLLMKVLIKRLQKQKKHGVKIIMIAEVKGARTVEEAQDKLDYFREAAQPSANYGIVLYCAKHEDLAEFGKQGCLMPTPQPIEMQEEDDGVA